jgi:hypothetical protein
MPSYSRPYLVNGWILSTALAGWVLSSALALTLVFWLNNPFTGPIEVDFSSLTGLADRLAVAQEFGS